MDVKNVGRVLNSINETKLTDSEGRKEVSEWVRTWNTSSYSNSDKVNEWNKIMGRIAGCNHCPCDGKCSSDCVCKSKYA